MTPASYFENHHKRVVKKIISREKYTMFVFGSFAAHHIASSRNPAPKRVNKRSKEALFPRFIVFDNSVGNNSQQNNECTKVELRVHFFFFVEN